MVCALLAAMEGMLLFENGMGGAGRVFFENGGGPGAGGGGGVAGWGVDWPRGPTLKPRSTAAALLGLSRPNERLDQSRASLGSLGQDISKATVLTVFSSPPDRCCL